MTIDLPISINAMYKTTKQGGFYKATAAKNWIDMAGWDIKKQNRNKCITSPVYVGITMYVSRDRDVDSGIKPLLDLLQTQRVYENDSQVVHLNVRKVRVKKGDERCELVVEPTDL